MSEPLVLHSTFIVAHSAMAESEEELLAQVYERMTHAMAYELARIIPDAKGGLILTPLTFTINDDDQLGAARVAGTINATRLPDPSEGMFYLSGGRMDGRQIRVGDPAPEWYRIPWVPPVSIYSTEPSLILEYRRVRGATAYRFVEEVRMPSPLGERAG